MAEPAIHDFRRLPRIDPAWRLPTEAELPCEDDEPLAESDYQLEPLGYAFYGLRGHYAERADVAVHAAMFVHCLRVDEHGEVRLNQAAGKPIADRLAPDVFVVFGVPSRRRDSYVACDEGKPPDFVLEVLSESTWRRDMGARKTIYERMGVQEYWILDPLDAYVDPPPLKGFRLIGNRYEPIAPMPGSGIVYASEALGLELRLSDGGFRIRDPATGEDLRGPTELAEALAGLHPSKNPPRSYGQRMQPDCEAEPRSRKPAGLHPSKNPPRSYGQRMQPDCEAEPRSRKLDAETTARGREEVLRREIEAANRRERTAHNDGEMARRLAEAKPIEAQAALLRTETALRQAESALDEAQARRLDAEARHRDAETAAQQDAERIAQLEAQLQRQTGDR